jgi:hypothetical protein
MHKTSSFASISIWRVCFLFSAIILYACEDNTNVKQQRGVRRTVKPSSTSGSISLTKYQKVGNGLKEAPPWISNQDLNVMRLHEEDTLKGYRNGNEFIARGVWIERRERGWFLIVNEFALNYPTQFTYDGQRVEIPLGDQLNGQSKLDRTFEDSSARWLIPSSTFVRGKTSVWESDNLFSIEMLDWRVKPYKKNTTVFQVTGVATGRLLAYFKDNQNVQGWITGRFENVPVRYMGDPSAW